MTGPRWKAGACWGLLLSLVSSLSAPGVAHAQTDAQQKAAAEALFDEGRQLLSQGQYESACKRFEQSQEIDPGVGTLLYLGDCYERSGKAASAWAIFREASSAALAAGQADRGRLADERARKLSVGLSKIVLLVPQENRVTGFELLLDGRVLSPALFGVPFPVDAGRHELTARSPGRSTWSNVVEIKPNADYRNVQIPPLAGAGPAVTPYDTVPPTTAVRPAVAPGTYTGEQGLSTDQGAGTSGRRPDRTPAYLIGGAGVVALGVGAVFGLRASDKDEDAKSDCPSDCLTTQGADLNASARSSALIANISYGVGVVALATGAYLFFSSGSSDPASAGGRGLAPSGAADAPGLEVGVAWGTNEGRVSVAGSF
ncbi:MAG: tetratricopeptide repeat protein [Deltaproteobacteria bacterium]